MRLELIGLSVTPQHSDARVLDQILYKWDHSRRIIARVLVEKYDDLVATGWEPTNAEIQRDVQDLFGGAFERFCGRQQARETQVVQRAAVTKKKSPRGTKSRSLQKP